MAGVWVAVAVAAVGLMSCTREVSGSSVTPNRASTVDLGSVLLDADEIDEVIGTSGSEVFDEGDAPDDVTGVNPPKCHGLVYIAGEIEYGSTNFIAMRWRVVGHGNASNVVEMAAQLPSVAKADEFIHEQTQAWERCADEVITSSDKANASTTQDRVTAVEARPRMVISSMDSLSRGTPCRNGQHLLQAVSTVILDVSVACGNNVSNPAEAIASQLADRVRSG
jgi:hypothetical protein